MQNAQAGRSQCESALGVSQMQGMCPEFFGEFVKSGL